LTLFLGEDFIKRGSSPSLTYIPLPLLREGGQGDRLLDISGYLLRGIKRGEAPLRNFLPSPLMKGRGIKGEGLVNNLTQVRVELEDGIIE